MRLLVVRIKESMGFYLVVDVYILTHAKEEAQLSTQRIY